MRAARGLYILIALTCLGASPAARVPILNGQNSDAACDRLINQSAPTLWLDSSKLSTITQADNAVSAWASRYGAISFTQATAANKPKLTRGDNLENRIIASTTFASPWVAYKTTIAADTSGTTDPLGGTTAYKLTESGAGSDTHNILSGATSVVSGQVYVASFYFKRPATNGRHAQITISGTGSPASNWADWNITTGAFRAKGAGASSTTIEAVGAWYRCSITFTAAATNTVQIGVRLEDDSFSDTYTSDAVSYVWVWGAQLRSSLADATYLATTTAPQYRGVNGRPAVLFDGMDDVLNSTAQLVDIFAAGAKTILAGARSEAGSSTTDGYILASLNTYFVLYKESATNGNQWSVFNNDGSPDNLVGTAPVLNTTQIITSTHSSLLSLTQNGENAVPAASENTSAMDRALSVGNEPTATRPFAGPITDVLTWNKVLPASTINAITKCKARQRGADLQ